MVRGPQEGEATPAARAASLIPPSLLFRCSILSSGQTHPAFPPWPCSGLLPAACTVDMAGFRELPLGGRLRTRLGKAPLRSSRGQAVAHHMSE